MKKLKLNPWKSGTKVTISQIFQFGLKLVLYLVLVCHFSILAAQNDSKIVSADKFFDGFYAGLEMGSQNIFGGSLIDGKDVLAQKSGFVADFFTGYRKQFLNDRLLAGADLLFGITDGDLMFSNPEEALEINYKNNTQFGYGLKIGVVLGKQKRFLIFAYGNETKRKFDVDIQQGVWEFSQTDKQGMIKYGLGLEAKVFNNLNVRVKVGGLSVDFGDLETNIDVEDKIDIMAGVLFQF